MYLSYLFDHAGCADMTHIDAFRNRLKIKIDLSLYNGFGNGWIYSYVD
jgi:hypothetical protein